MNEYNTPSNPGHSPLSSRDERDLGAFEDDQEFEQGGEAGQGGRGNSAMSRVGRGLQKAGSRMRERAPEEGRIHDAADAIANRVERAGQYLEERDFRGVAEDVTDVVRRYPVHEANGMVFVYVADNPRSDDPPALPPPSIVPANHQTPPRGNADDRCDFS